MATDWQLRSRDVSKWSVGAALALALLIALPPAANAAENDVQIRDFLILVNGKEKGKYQMRISRRDDESVVVSSEAAVKMNFVVYSYQYTSKGAELWKQGRLHRLKNTANFNGSEFALNAVATEKGLAVKLNGNERVIRADVWPTSYWQQPQVKVSGQTLPLLDLDKGEERQGVLHYVGQRELNVVGKPQKCHHYKVRGGVEVDLWYDSQERLVRQESMQAGHRITMELAKIADEELKVADDGTAEPADRISLGDDRLPD